VSDEAPSASLAAPADTVGGVAVGSAAEATKDDRGTHHGLHRRNDRILLGTIAAYVGFLSILMILKGVSITPDVMLVALGLAAVVLGRGRLFIRDWVPFIGLFLAYELMRGYADDLGATIHSADVLALERALFGGALPTEVLQRALHPATGVDPWAIGATVFYFLHFPLPLAVGFLLWVRHRRTYYDFVAALILVSMAGFATYLVLPVAPPWWAAEHGLIPGPSGAPAITYLKQQAFDDLGRMLGFAGNYLYTYTIYDINPNQVAAFPSLHAGYPFLAFLFARRAFGKSGWLMLLYAACVWFSIVYLADHYVVDIIGGLAYASVAYAVVVHAPGWFRRFVDRAADPSIEAEVEEGEATGRWRGRWRLAERISWPALATGLAVAAAGVIGLVLVDRAGWLGGRSSPGLLIPWALVIGGLWRSALAVLTR
jgi:hypothetical protein